MTESGKGERIAAVVALCALGLRQVVHTEITTGYVLAFLLVPLWAPCVRRFGGARSLLIGAFLMTMWGFFLGKFAQPPHMVNGPGRNGALVAMLGTVLGIGVVLWARTLMPLPRITLWYGIGMLFGGALGYTSGSDNPWKFVWAVPVALVLLSLVALRRRLEVIVLALLMLVSLLNDSRSYFAAFSLAAILVIWQARPKRLSQRASWIYSAVMLAGLGVAIYFLITELLVSGYLGKAAQERSIAQIQTSGSLLLGGRPELAATLALLRHHPWGFGAGVVPSSQDVMTAKTGMAGIGYDPNNGYVERFMFGGHIELHSLFGDLWAAYGIPGLIFTAAVGVFVARGIASGIAHRTASAALLFIGTWTLWNIPFSPFGASEPTLILAVGLVLLPAGKSHRYESVEQRIVGSGSEA